MSAAGPVAPNGFPPAESQTNRVAEQQSQQTGPVQGQGFPDEDSSPFECNICLELAKDPVVTVCGHLYCWRCLYRWYSEQGANTCPVCKAGLDVSKVIPIYCRDADAPYGDGKDAIPDRPQAQRPLPVARTVHAEPAQGQQPGILPTLFGIHGGGQGAPMTPEQQHQAFLSRLLLLLGSFVILCLLLF
ncbi:hypothetical protein BSKO_05291 [Bryopsis sp. KO-2023]|nr:hypothetical protein BSKO_05291 [Bryopsis sp. KO-2023]